MTLLTIIAVLIIVGFLLWLVNTYIPMAGPIKTLINLIVIIMVVIWLLQVFGLMGPIQGVLDNLNNSVKLK